MSLHYFLGFSTLKLPRKVKLKTNQKPLNLQFEKEAKVEAVLRTNSLLLVAFWLAFPPALDNVVALKDTSLMTKSSNST